MRKAKILDNFSKPGLEIGEIVNIVELDYSSKDAMYLIELPERLKGQGHTGFMFGLNPPADVIFGIRVHDNDYWWLNKTSVEMIDLKVKLINLSLFEKRIGLHNGDVVHAIKLNDEIYEITLPEHLWGKGHSNYGSREPGNKWFVEPYRLKVLDE